ncbi:MAG TPA: hypothetical protein VLT34_04045 [Arthrobacter sp.]|nr:hypothetical protein [Arthrobacter sp.]
MAKTPLEDFLNECVARDPDGDGLSVEELYGLYLSWCGLVGSTPVRSKGFRAGLRTANIRPAGRGSPCPGLKMTGPAACDYLVHRELPLVELDAPDRRPRQVSPPASERVASRPGPPAGPVIGSVPAA